MTININWLKDGYRHRKAICQKYGLPMTMTVNKRTLDIEVTPEVREALRLGESNKLFYVYNERL